MHRWLLIVVKQQSEPVLGQIMQQIGAKKLRVAIVGAGVNGSTLLATRFLKEDSSTKDIPVIACIMSEDGARILEASCAGYIPKPVDIRQFVKLVASLLTSETQEGS